MDLYFCESTTAINFPCSNSWLKIGVNDVIFSKSAIVEDYTNTGAKVFVLLCANCCTNCYYNVNPCGMFEKYDVIYSNSQRRIETGKINGGAKFSEIKVQKTHVVMFVMD